ncbi:Nn.00g107410.m01.CDS01 [Neocucurbitaria sp. VM-36]
MPRYTPWTWSQPHGRHYSYLLADDGVTILETVWSGPPANPGVADTLAAASAHHVPESIQQPTSPVGQSTTYQPSTLPSQVSTADITYTTRNASPQSSRSQQTTRPSYSSIGSGLNQRGRPAQEVEDQREVADDDDDDRVDNRTSQGHYRVDSGTAAITQSLGSLNIGPTTGNRLQPPSTGPTYTYQSNPQQGYGSSSSSKPQQGYAYSTAPAPAPQPTNPRTAVAFLPPDVQAHIGYLDRRFIQSSSDPNNAEQLDPRFRRVARNHHAFFFVLGRVFKMLWTEPAGQANPGKTRNSTHFSTVRFGEQAYSEIRRFVVVRNKGNFSQCIPIQTYKGQGATKSGIVMSDHGVIHTSVPAPNLLPGEYLNKYSIQVIPTENEILEPQSRVNYGKAYAVEHNVKVLDIGMVMEGHKYLIQSYFDSAMRGQ